MSFGVHDAGPGGPKLIFFRSGHRPSAFLPSGGLGGCFWKVFGTTVGYLEVSFVDDFEKARVFVRCTDSTLSLDRLFPCYARLLALLDRVRVCVCVGASE